MLMEGKGNIAPAPQVERLSDGTLALLEHAAQERARLRGYNARGDRWGQGFRADAILMGLVAEQACGQYLGRRLSLSLSADTTLRARGDGGRDFEIFGERVQVKSRGRVAHNLIRRIADDGRILPMDWHVCVFAQWSSAALQRNAVNLLGWVTNEEARQRGARVKSKVGDHHNLRLEDADLRPMAQLIERLELRREL